MATRPRLPLFAALAFAAGPALAQGDDLHLGGHVKAFHFQGVSDPYVLDRAGSRLQLAASGGQGEPADYFAAIDFEIDSRLLHPDQPARRGQGFEIYPVEIYLNLASGPFELKLGQQFIFWGRADWINPTDVITAWDYANMASEIEDYRRAPMAVRLNWYVVGELMLDLVWAPVFSPNRIPSGVPEQIGGVALIEADPRLPKRRLKNGEFGARLSHSISALALDWSLCAYQGFEKNPSYVVAPVLDVSRMPPAPTHFTWQRRYDRLTLVGADFAKAISSVVIKGEAALKLTEDEDGTDPVVQNSRAEYVLGVDTTFVDDLDLGVQYIGTYRLDYDRSEEVKRQTDPMGNAPPFVAQRVSHQGSLRMRLQIIDEVGAQVIAVANLVNQDFFAIGFVAWDIADALKLFVGGVGFGGRDDDTPHARQRDNSRAFFEIKYSF